MVIDPERLGETTPDESVISVTLSEAVPKHPLVHQWFRRSTTMRFRPTAVTGSLSGEPALDTALLTSPS